MPDIDDLEYISQLNTCTKILEYCTSDANELEDNLDSHANCKKQYDDCVTNSLGLLIDKY